MPHKKILLALTLFLLLSTGCTAQPVSDISSAPQQVIRVGLPPVLSYLVQPLSTCADDSPVYDIVLLEKNSPDWVQEPIDMVFTLGQALPNVTNTYLIDNASIQIIASPDFSLDTLTMQQLQQLYAADGQPEDLPGSFTLWGFENNSEMAGLFRQQYQFKPDLPGQAYLAATPQLMTESIARGQMAVGYTLSGAVTQDVKLIKVTDAPSADPVPVIASVILQPSPAQEDLLRCLQSPQD